MSRTYAPRARSSTPSARLLYTNREWRRKQPCARRRSGLSHRPIFAATGQQLFMAAALDDPARFHHQDHIGVAYRRKPVRDNETRSITAQLDHSVLDQKLGPGVDGAGCFVK